MAFSSKGSRSSRDKEQKKAEQCRLEAALEEGLKDTFPASDAVAVIQPAPERNILPEIELKDAELNEDQQTGERQPVGHRQA
jgi:hypothetical protein